MARAGLGSRHGPAGPGRGLVGWVCGTVQVIIVTVTLSFIKSLQPARGHLGKTK